MKKLVSILLAALMVISLLPTMALADDYTIANVLATAGDEFNSWDCGAAQNVSVIGSKFGFHNMMNADEYDLTTVLTADGDNWKLAEVGRTVTFTMRDNKLVSITYEGTGEYEKYNGTYTLSQPTVTINEVKSVEPWDSTKGTITVDYSLSGIDANVDYKVVFAVTAGDSTASATNVAAKLTAGKQPVKTIDTTTLFGKQIVAADAKVKVSLVATEPLGGIQLWEGGPFFAECNVGAEKPEEYGYYFWWGVTVGYTHDNSNSKWVSSVDPTTSISFNTSDATAKQTYNKSKDTLTNEGWIDANGNLAAAHDAATVKLGAPWRMPTAEELQTLITCTCNGVDNYQGTGIKGCTFTGKGDYASNSIFLPAAGYGNQSNIYNLNSACCYRSSTPANSDMYTKYLYFSSAVHVQDGTRIVGYSVRPVRDADTGGTETVAATAETTFALGPTAHTHSFTYAASGAVLTATCGNEGCTLPGGKVTLTLTAPASLAYDGNVKSFTFADGEAAAWKAAVGSDAPTIFYYVKQSGQSAYMPLLGNLKDVGNYMAEIVVDKKAARVEFTITKAAADAPASGEGYTVDYVNETFTPAEGYEVSTGSGDNFASGKLSGETAIDFTKTYYVRKTGGTSGQTEFSFTRPAAVTGVTAQQETIMHKDDAYLRGVTKDMQYRVKFNGGAYGDWFTGYGSSIGFAFDVKPDPITRYDVEVRSKATATAFAGETTTFTFLPNTTDKLTVTMGKTSARVAYDSLVTKPADPVKNGYTFGGWYVDEKCTEAWNFASDTVTEDMTLYAKWTKNGSSRRGSSSVADTVVAENMPLLKVGSRRGDVKTLQTMLNELGYDCGNVDGIFGSKTQAAVIAFQKANGLAVDGIVGPETWGELSGTGVASVAAVSVETVTISSNMPLITTGNSGDTVKTLQAKLNELGYDCGTVDGIYGPKTLAAVKAYQTAKGLSVDGVVGSQTWNALR